MWLEVVLQCLGRRRPAEWTKSMNLNGGRVSAKYEVEVCNGEWGELKRGNRYAGREISLHR